MERDTNGSARSSGWLRLKVLHVILSVLCWGGGGVTNERVEGGIRKGVAGWGGGERDGLGTEPMLLLHQSS